MSHEKNTNYQVSHEIIRQNRLEKRRLYSLNPVRCLVCDSALKFESRKDKFCSKSCGAKYFHRGRINLFKVCRCCNKSYAGKKTSYYCSLKCVQEHRYKTWIKKWQSGEISGTTGKADLPVPAKPIRRYLFKKYNNACSECGWNKINRFTNKIPLHIHHIDGNAANNSENNLQLLCPGCHTLTQNYGRSNKNSVRTRRRQSIDSDTRAW